MQAVNGSPLRGQGTRLSGSVRKSSRRFTPARAGNTPPRSTVTTASSVHPCAGREHVLPFYVGAGNRGSPLRGQGTPSGATVEATFAGSPLRGQGTRPRSYPPRPHRRFTPARAGNTRRIQVSGVNTAVHPCAGREHLLATIVGSRFIGSPLRGQGTPWPARRHSAIRRFTPARAGNTSMTTAGWTGTSVHPCAGREHWRRTVRLSSSSGSPLRGQGTRVRGGRAFLRGRFTPARAGNTRRTAGSCCSPPVHPCAGREHPSCQTPEVAAPGSPLRGQGTHPGAGRRIARDRFTPARAGNTLWAASRRRLPTVHPCAGREHPTQVITATLSGGSPLRGQGTLWMERRLKR